MGTTLPWNRALIQEQYLANQNRSVMQGVTQHIFALRADMARLRRFIDSYLNFVDDDMPPPFYFQPAAPFVIFELIYYPYLTVASRNLISYPQREMSFTIPLECYAIEEGMLVFKQYASCVPFLYVDEEISIVAGRELFGLPKVAIKFENLIDAGRPDVPRQIGRLTLRTPGKDGDVYVPFIEIYHEPSRYISFREAPQKLISALPEALQSYYTLVSEAWEAYARPPLRGYENQRDLASMLGMIRANADTLSASLPVFPFMRVAPQFAESSADEQLGPIFMDLISLKQARDAERVELVSFQSLVRSTMYIDRINDGGFLFSPLASNPSSDITVKIHHRRGQPLVESLGLVTEATIATDGRGRSKGADGDNASDPTSLVSILRPLLPYWMNVDLTYGLGTNLYWRGRDTEWSSTDNPGPPSGGNRYITVGSGALQEDVSRIVAPNSQIWVLRLPLDEENGGEERLRRLCLEHLKNDCYVFRLTPYLNGQKPSVWMFIRNMDNTGEGQGPEVEQEVAFGAVVDWFLNKNGQPWGPPIGQLLMPLFVLSDNETAVFTESEVFGCPTVRADISFEGANWTSTFDLPMAAMNVDTLIIPELYSGDSAERRRIVRVAVAASSSEHQIEHLPTNVLNLPTVNLKQIIDCRLPGRVDFQAIVARVLAIHPHNSTAKLSMPLEPKRWSVNIDRYGSLPLVQKMGLKVSDRKRGKYTTIEVIQPIGVWSASATIEELGGVNLAWRLGNSPWMSHKEPLGQLKKIAPEIANIADVLFFLPRLLSAYQRFARKRKPIGDVPGGLRSYQRLFKNRELNENMRKGEAPREDRRKSFRPKR
jgi:hypothetical protein